MRIERGRRSARVGAGLAAALVLSPGVAHAGAVDRAAAWLVAGQHVSGAFGSADAPADGVAETMASLAAAGVTGEPISRALGYLRERGPARAAEQPAYAGRIAMGLFTAGRDPRAFGGADYVAVIERGYDALTGEFDAAGLYANALAALGYVAGSERIPDAAVRYLRAHECPGGGFGHAKGCLSDPDADTTALTLAVLAHAGLDTGEPIVARALDFLRSTQAEDGGFGLTPGAPTNANSTGLVLSALAAFELDPRGWDGDPVRALRALQARSGGFRYVGSQDAPNAYATVQALPGLLGLGHPMRAPSIAVPPPMLEEAARDGRRSPPPERAGASEPAAPSAVARGTAIARAVAIATPPVESASPSRAVPIVLALTMLLASTAGVVLARRMR